MRLICIIVATVTYYSLAVHCEEDISKENLKIEDDEVTMDPESDDEPTLGSPLNDIIARADPESDQPVSLIRTRKSPYYDQVFISILLILLGLFESSIY